MEHLSSFIFDIILIALLGLTISYCLKLSRQLQIIRDSKGEMATLIRQFGEATENARASVEELKSNSRKIIDSLQTKIEKATFAADDLTFLMERAGKIGTNLEKKPAVSNSGDINRLSTPSNLNNANSNNAMNSAKPEQSAQKDTPPRSQAERELLEALKSIR